ncbi:MAG TPA: GGDEF domain-containing protein [Burkholderiaceae bacterium]|nr:GGDEF domain-containing protein [Burkholderiaceae bacterium]
MRHSDPTAAPPDADAPGGRRARGAFWRFVRRAMLVALAVDLGFVLLFAAIGATAPAVLHLPGLALYLGGYLLLRARRNLAAIVLVGLATLGHAVVGTLSLGWSGGFFHYLVLFVPAIVAMLPSRPATAALGAVIACLVGLERASAVLGPLAPVGDGVLAVVHAVNAGNAYTMMAGLVLMYIGRVRQAERQLEMLAHRDALTGLSNRRHFVVEAERVLQAGRARGVRFSVLLADVDLFKRINDEHGHAAGDRVLVDVSDRLREQVGADAPVARWGGEEFVALLRDTSTERALQVGEAIRRSLATRPLAADGGSPRVTLSIGVAEVQGDETLAAAIDRADRAMYLSKHGGRDAVSASRPAATALAA